MSKKKGWSLKNIHKIDLNTFNSLFSDYYINLCRFAYTYLKSTDASEELVQELFLKIWEDRGTIDITTSIRSFLYTSVKNRALNFLRDEKTRLRHHEGFGLEQRNMTNCIIDFCEREDLSNLIDQAIEELPSRCKKVFDLCRVQNMSHKEIAEKLSISPKTVENQMGIALKKIRDKLLPYLSFLISII
jgi:RNA polymerase sigma-70 factor (ECF subfamily)